MIQDLENQLVEECFRMRVDTAYSGDFHYWPWAEEGHQECGHCTNGVYHLAKKFGGRVVGYRIPSDSPKLAGGGVGGHDFAIIGNFLVDWWAWDYEMSIPVPVLERTRDIECINLRYLPESHWKELYRFENKEVVCEPPLSQHARMPKLVNVGTTVNDPFQCKWTFDTEDHLHVVNGKDCTITLEPRPHYCDRGNFLARLEATGDLARDLDSADLWPRFYFDLTRAKLEIEAWLEKRKRLIHA